jgi:streptomycin 6-kinase
VLIGLLPRLWQPTGEPFHTLADEAAWWFPKLPQTRLGEAAREARVAGRTQGQVLLHQDLHGDNVLAAEREPWLVIDPKPLAYERAVRRRADRSLVGARRGEARRPVPVRPLTSELGLDRERARGWTIAQTVAWSSGAWHDSVAEWLL